MGHIYLAQEELKVRRIDYDAMMEQDAVHIGYEADVTAHLLDTNGKKIGVTHRASGHRTPITVLHMGGRYLWMSFLVVENLDDSDQFILGRDFVMNFDVIVDLNNGLIRIRSPDRKYDQRGKEVEQNPGQRSLSGETIGEESR